MEENASMGGPIKTGVTRSRLRGCVRTAAASG